MGNGVDRYCSHCGRQLDANANFCGGCGTELSSGDRPSGVGRYRVALIATAVVAVAGGAVLLALNLGGKDTASSQDGDDIPIVQPTATRTSSPRPTATPTATSTPTPPPTPTNVPVQIANGSEMQDRIGQGSGELQVTNGTQHDAIVKLFDPLAQRSIRAVYVVRDSAWTITGIPQGMFVVRFAHGLGWDDADLRFQTDRSFSEFEEPFPFTETATTYSIWEITLHPIVGGTAETEAIDAATFAQ